MRVVAADSSAAILNSDFKPLFIVAAAAVLVKPPYREPNDCLAKPIFANTKNSPDVIVQEADLCREILGRVKADIVHLDMSLGAVPPRAAFTHPVFQFKNFQQGEKPSSKNSAQIEENYR